MKKLLTEWRQYLKESRSSNARKPQLHTSHASGEYFEDFLENYAHYDGKSIKLNFGSNFKNHPQRNEPQAALWTSTAQDNSVYTKKKNSYTSEWDEHNKGMDSSSSTRQFESIGSLLMQADPDARILEISDDNYEQVLTKYGVGTKPGFLNWENIAKDYDAIHFDGPIKNLRTIEIESTVILDPSKYSVNPIRTWENLLSDVAREGIGSPNNRPMTKDFYLPIIKANPDFRDRKPSQQELVAVFNEEPLFKEYVLNLEL